ncbi:MAG: carboxypeptidase-like regulatory domain-containing protein [Omnitrophica bacterium]|nr:carboxypeptidase-like regulatory domain-containing protein [Candidatus Omnitrophota bacterium]
MPEGMDGHELEILEQKLDSYIIKVHKDEIEIIKKKRPDEIKLWRGKKILWEDTEDYITIYLPKERIVLPEDYTGDEYDSARALQKELEYTGEEGRPVGITSWKDGGKIVGRVVKRGLPLAGVKLKVANVSSQQNVVSSLFGPKDKRPEDLVFETTSDESGKYEFRNVPVGAYDIYWSAPGTTGWFRQLSEKPNITVRPGETVRYRDIELKPSR